MMFSRKIASININAISSAVKRGLLKDFVRNNDIDFIFLQEVAFENFDFLPTHFSLVNSSNECNGTAVLIRNNFEFSNVLMHPSGRILSVSIEGFNFINVYAHSGSKYRKERDALFSEEIVPHLSTDLPNIILGDFNCIILKGDSNGIVKNISQGLKTLISELDLIDIGKVTMKKTVYTFYRGDSMSRLDRIYAPDDFLKMVDSFESNATCFSDHHALLLKYKVNSNSNVIPIGRGYWKINPTILHEEDVYNEFLSLIRTLRNRAVYANDFSRWWNEHFKTKAKSFFKSKSFEMNQQIESSKSFLYGCLKEISNKQKNGEDVSKEMSFVKSKLMNIEQNRINNLKLKLSDDSILEDEKLSLFQISKKIVNKYSKHTMKLDVRGEITSKPSDLKPFLEEHFINLFNNDNTFHPGVDNVLNFINTRITAEDSIAISRPIELEELICVLQQASKKKSPGPDGLTYEFYSVFFEEIKDDLLKLFNLYLSGSLPPSCFVEGIITLIPKKDKSFELSDRRPISMLNCDYKLFTKILMNRLQPLLPNLIGPGQAACITEKSCVTNIKLLRNLSIKATQSKRIKVLLVSLDLDKAFDRVDHNFLWLVLEKFGFPQCFVTCIRNLYKRSSSKILFNGFLTRNISVRSSVRQGCPLSMSLFVLYIEPLIRMLYDNVQGVLIDNSFIKVIVYADDINILIRNNHEFDKALELINYFSIYAKIKLNIKKSAYMRLNNCYSGPHLLKEVRSLKILGIDIHDSFKGTVDQNYSSIIQKIKYLVVIHQKRFLNVFQKTWILNTLILSKLWYLAQIYPPNNCHIASIRTICRNFIFKGLGLYKVEMNQLYLDVDRGGLSLVDVESKMKALFVKNILFHQNNRRDSFILAQNSRTLTRNALEWISNAQEVADHDNLTSSKLIYSFFLSKKNIFPKIQLKLPNNPWEIFWENLNKNYLDSNTKQALFLMFNDIVPTKEKLFKHKIRGTDNNLCNTCGLVDSVKHRIQMCKGSKIVWEWVALKIKNGLKLNIEDPEKILGKEINVKNLQSKTCLWLVTNAIEYNLKHFAEGNVMKFQRFLYDKRWNLQKCYVKEFGKWVNVL